jgi:phosphoesterase RecJ-like protein
MSYQRAIEALRSAQSIVLATHVNPDADTLGSALGLYHSLRALGKKATVVNTTQLPYNLDFLAGITKVKKELPKTFDLLVCLDAGSFDRLGIEKPEVTIVNIDHHKSNTLYGDVNLVEPTFAATAQVVYELLKKGDFPIPKESAEALYTALVDDCGFFKYESVNEKVFLCAADLCRFGANPHEIAKKLTMREPLSKLRLTQKLLETLELYIYGKVGVITLTQQMLKETGAKKEMADDVLAMVRSLASVEVAILLREEEDGRIKVSLRSKDSVDVSKIAVEFGGGGHKNAAGFTDGKSFEEILGRLLERLKKEFVFEAKE